MRIFLILFAAISTLQFSACQNLPRKMASQEPGQARKLAAEGSSPGLNANPGIVTISDPSVFRQVVVISDVHGMYLQLVNLLLKGKLIDPSNKWIGANSLLIVAGDSIDKGPQSIEVLNLWLSLSNQAPTVGGKILHLLGNHEAEFLANPKRDPKASSFTDEMSAEDISISDFTSMSTPIGQFVLTEPLAAKVGLWIFSHSGRYPSTTWADFGTKAASLLSYQNYDDDFILGQDSILEAKKWERDPSSMNEVLANLDAIGAYGDVFGHQPGAFGIKGRSAAKASGRLIKIDNGMAPEAGSNPGSLLIFTQPKQMLVKAYPEIQIMNAQGIISTLIPE